IFERPRPLSRQRRANHLYTLICEEPVFGPGWGWQSADNLELDVVAPLQRWLDSSQADNLIRSLRNKRNRNARGVAALVAGLDGPAYAMIRTLELHANVPISTPLRLRDGMDEVVLVAGEQVVAYGRNIGWRRMAAPACAT
ncbi:hypothetical protein ACJH6H_29690, partial [Mycobacterium sp. SMC-21]|uniref:hypothetical protein n=1 Tax=Mycobacterium sp. SMC-21 TaxID=3381632 RepID=UPI0038777A35